MTRPTMDEVEAQLVEQKRRRDLARLAAYTMHARHDPRETTRGAFEARMRRYELQIDPTGELKARDPQALTKRIQAALAADMAKVRLARTQKRAHATEAKAKAKAREHAQVEASKKAIIEKLHRTPPDDLEQLATLVLALQALGEQSF